METKKIWSDQYELVRLGAKTFDVRAELASKPGDVLKLEECRPTGVLTERSMYVQITFQLRSDDCPAEWGLPKGFVVSALKVLKEVR